MTFAPLLTEVDTTTTTQKKKIKPKNGINPKQARTRTSDLARACLEKVENTGVCIKKTV